MLITVLTAALPRDLPVCFPGRPCLEFSPYVADAINLTSGLTPASREIAIGGLAVLGLALVFVIVGLTTKNGPRLGVVALSTALVILGTGIAIVLEARSSAIFQIYGPDLPAGTELYGSWDVVSLVAEGIALLGLLSLAATATVAVTRLRHLRPTRP